MKPDPIAVLDWCYQEITALCEHTEDDPTLTKVAITYTEIKQGAYARGRQREAKGIRNAMGEAIRLKRQEIDACLALPQSEEPTTSGSAEAALRQAYGENWRKTLWEAVNGPGTWREQPLPASADRVRVTEDTLQHICSLIGEGDSVTDRAGRRSAKRAVRRLCNRIAALEAALSATPEQGRVEELERENAELRNRLHELDPAIRAYRILGDPSVAVTSAPRATTDHDGGADV